MMQIIRLTVAYDAREDRLALWTAGPDEQVRCLWLTRRLADRLVSSLTQQIDGGAAGTAAIFSASSSPPPDSAHQAAQVYAQLEARLAKQAAVPVAASEAAVQVLVSEVNIARSRSRWRLEWICLDAVPARLVLNATQLRQWLQAMHHAYLKAGWPMSVWPAWMGKPRKKPALK